MSTGSVEEQKREIIARYGAWTAHNIKLDADTYTMFEGIQGDEHKLRRMLQIIADVSSKPMSQLRVLDLGCLEGLYSIELAMRGATVIAIDGRSANIEKARFAQQVLAVQGVDFIQDDIRTVDVEKYGTFDVVLCLNVLFVVDAPQVPGFIQGLANLCDEMAIIETDLGYLRSASYHHEGQVFEGVLRYPPPAPSGREEGQALWNALDSPVGFDLTRSSLCNALSLAGFTSVFECHVPSVPEPTVRSLFVAVQGDRQSVIANPVTNTEPLPTVPEERQFVLMLVRMLRSAVPVLSRREWLRSTWLRVPASLRRAIARRMRST